MLVDPAETLDSVMHPELWLLFATDPARRARLHEILSSYCHECRNDLNSLKLSLYLAGRSGTADDLEPWSELERLYCDVERQFDFLQQIYRPMPLIPVTLPIGLLLDEAIPAWKRALEDRGLTLQVVAPASSPICSFDPTRLKPALDAFVKWRSEVAHPGRLVTLNYGEEDECVRVDWIETDPCCRSSSCRVLDGMAVGLSLPLLARVLAAHGGTLACTSTDGFHLRLRWPVRFGNTQ